jgi:hypothetical protein
MNDRQKIRERYLSEPLPNRLGELAANLARIKSFSSNLQNGDAIRSLIEESKFFIEWVATDLDIEQAAELVEIQVQLARWQLTWSNTWNSESVRVQMVEQTKIWSATVLGMSGLLSEPTAVPSKT